VTGPFRSGLAAYQGLSRDGLAQWDRLPETFPVALRRAALRYASLPPLYCLSNVPSPGSFEMWQDVISSSLQISHELLNCANRLIAPRSALPKPFGDQKKDDRQQS